MFGLTPYRSGRYAAAYNPFREMEDFEKNFFGEPFREFFTGNALSEFKTDIRDQRDSYLLEADLPGFEKSDIGLSLDGDVLTISAERRDESESKDEKNGYIRRERSFGKYSRAFDVSGVRTENISAKYDNGVLKLTLPKKQDTPPASRRLEIE